MIYRAEHTDGYVILANDLIRDTNLSDGAFRLLMFMLSMSDDWSFSIKGLAAQLSWSERKVRSQVCELKKAGYIVQKLQSDEHGRFLPCLWEVHETAIHKNRKAVKPQDGETAKRSNRKTVEPQCGKSAPIRNTNIKEIPNIEEVPKYKNVCALGNFMNVMLSDSEQKALCDTWGFDDVVTYIERLSVYLHQHPEKKYKDHKATIEKWIVQDRKKKESKI